MCLHFTRSFSHTLHSLQLNSNQIITAVNQLNKETYPSLDVRAKLLIFYDKGRIDTLCMNRSRILKDGKYYSNDSTLVRIVEEVPPQPRRW